MPPLPADRVYLVARAVLDAVVDHYATEGVDLPERRYVSDGPMVAWDCEQLVVYVERTFPGLADVEQPRVVDGLEVRSAVMQAEIVRCSPTIDDENAVNFPDPAEIEASAMLTLADAVLLPAAIRAAYKAGELGCCHDVVIGGWAGLGPMGSLVGGRAQITMQLTCEPTASGS